MKFRNSAAALGLSVLAALLILDSRTWCGGAADGVALCLKTVIPSLFPFFFLSALLRGALTGRSLPALAAASRLCGIPPGQEGLLLSGFLGGYPVGAAAVADSWRSGCLSDRDARRLLGFCSNAGPAFLFGMLTPLFSSPGAVWLLWGIHLASALLTGILLPGKPASSGPAKAAPRGRTSDAMTGSLKAMASVCGWVILFRAALAFLSRRMLGRLPTAWQVLLAGLLELTNGCCRLGSVAPEWLRFLLCAGMVAFGGLCVVFQTASVTRGLGIGTYLRGKLLQTVLSAILACPAAALLYPGTVPAPILAGAAVFALILAGTAFFRQKRTGNFRPVPV